MREGTVPSSHSGKAYFLGPKRGETVKELAGTHLFMRISSRLRHYNFEGEFVRGSSVHGGPYVR